MQLPKVLQLVNKMETFKKVLPAIVLALFLAADALPTHSPAWDSGAGTVYTLQVLKDVWLEGSYNKNNFHQILVGLHPRYPKKRFLVEFGNLPSGCSHIEWAKMYVYYAIAFKISSISVQQAPSISRTLQLHQVKKYWSETQATSTHRTSGTRWSEPYLALDGTDANPHALDSVTVFTSRPQGFIEFDVTEAVRNWQHGDSNYGILVWATNEDDEGRDLRFYSRSYSDSTKHAFINVLCS